MKSPLALTLLGALCAGVSSCGLPKDSEGTLDHVRASRQIRVGLIANESAGTAHPQAAALLRRLGAATGATPRVAFGDAEPLLSRLEAGELDLVIGRFARKTPWRMMVSLSPPLATAKAGEADIILAAAMQNGENQWIGLVEREARALPGAER